MPTPLEHRDLVVVVPGITGSTLVKGDREVWGPSAGAIWRALRTRGNSIRELTLPEDVRDDHPGDGVVPGVVMPDLHVLPGLWTVHLGYGAMIDWLRARLALGPPVRQPAASGLVPFAYDWRLSNRFTARRLKDVVEPALEGWRARGPEYREAKLVFICHSMGGLVARWYLEKEGGAELTRHVITLGTPHRGSLNALVSLVNELTIGVGPVKADLTGLGRSLPSLHQLLPEYACIESAAGLLKLAEGPGTGLDTRMVTDAMRFHDQMHEAAGAREGADEGFHPIVGIRQPTSTTARIADGRVIPMPTIEGKDEAGDATVPRLSATPRHVPPDSGIIRWVADQHGALQSNRGIFDEIEGILTADDVIHKAPPAERLLGVELQDLALAGDPIPIAARLSEGQRIGLLATITTDAGRPAGRVQLQPNAEDNYAADLGPLPPGGYIVRVGGLGSMAARVDPVTSAVVVVEGA